MPSPHLSNKPPLVLWQTEGRDITKSSVKLSTFGTKKEFHPEKDEEY